MSDTINHPSHYVAGRRHEPIDVIEDWDLGFCLGNAVKYISRAGRKADTVEDLQKAAWYLQREIDRLAAPERPADDPDHPKPEARVWRELSIKIVDGPEVIGWEPHSDTVALIYWNGRLVGWGDDYGTVTHPDHGIPLELKDALETLLEKAGAVMEPLLLEAGR